MTNKVVLIRPENVYNYNNYPPLGLISLASSLKKYNFDVCIINCALESNLAETLRNELLGALFVGVSMLTSEVPSVYSIIRHIRERYHLLPIVAGGMHCTLFPEQVANCDDIDYVIVGGGEEHIVCIAEMFKTKLERKEKIFTKKIVDIEFLPTPEYNLDHNIEKFITSSLTDKLSEKVKQPMRWLPYESSRGCPSKCAFCVNAVTNNNIYRKKSVFKVVNEIDVVVKKYKLTHLKIIDDNFFVDINRVKNIARRIIERKLNITWDAECRCDYFSDNMLNNDTLRLLKSSGLVQLTLGVESGSERTLQLMRKGIIPEQSELAVMKCNRFGIIARSSFMIEVPGERIEDIKQTILFINKLRKYKSFTCGIGTFRPYPKCELTKKLLEEEILMEPKDFYSWTSKDIIDLYTSTEQIRPWQVNGKYSEAASYYINMESAVRLGNYQIDNTLDKIKNSLFMLIAKIRNRLMFYKFPIDKVLYKRFLEGFYRKKGKELK